MAYDSNEQGLGLRIAPSIDETDVLVGQRVGVDVMERFPWSLLTSSLVLKGALLDRPVAGIAGRLYFTTDTGDRRLTRDNGSSWDDLIVDPPADDVAATPSLRTLGTGSRQACAGDDSRLFNARSPAAHHATHEPGGSDPMAVDAAVGVGSLRTLGTGSLQGCAGDDSRLSNSRSPTGHHATHEPGGSDAMAVDAAAATGSLRTLGTGAAQACPGNDARLSNSRSPSAHASTHQNGGADEVATATPAANAIPKAGAGGALAAGWLPLMVAAGGSHAAGAVGDPGATVHTPPYVWTDAAGYVPGSPFQNRYHPDRPPDPGLLYTSQSDEFGSGLNLSWTAINSGDGLSQAGEMGTMRIYQTSGVASHVCRGYVIAPPAGVNWLLAAKIMNEQGSRSGAGPGQAGLVLGVGGSLATPTTAEFLRYGGAVILDHANTTSSGYAAANNVRQGGSLPSNYTTTPQWLYLIWRYTTSTKLLESFYSLSGYAWVTLASVTLASAPVSVGGFVDAFSTTILPSLRMAYWRMISDGTRFTNLQIAS